MIETVYKYETHCHTAPVSGCAKASVKDTVRFYKDLGYDGIFLTNHFLDGNINRKVRKLPYEEQIEYYFSDYEEAVKEGETAGLKVFPGVELSYKGTDFLIYGPEKNWYLQHPEIMRMEKTEELHLLADAGAFVVQAHPYREAHYIDHIRLYPRCVHAVEVINSNQPVQVNEMADHYADMYGLLKTCGSDNHYGDEFFEHLRHKDLEPVIAGMCSGKPVDSVMDFIGMVRAGKMKCFTQSEQGDFLIL